MLVTMMPGMWLSHTRVRTKVIEWLLANILGEPEVP
jgi:hypothetical protein